jgi:hypothetical protein
MIILGVFLGWAVGFGTALALVVIFSLGFISADLVMGCLCLAGLYLGGMAALKLSRRGE